MVDHRGEVPLLRIGSARTVILIIGKKRRFGSHPMINAAIELANATAPARVGRVNAAWL
jgi:hypothetical protein